MADPHGCPGGCGSAVPYHHLACRPCWHRLPEPLRFAVTSGYRVRKHVPETHHRALRAALDWYRANPAGPPG